MQMWRSALPRVPRGRVEPSAADDTGLALCLESVRRGRRAGLFGSPEHPLRSLSHLQLHQESKKAWNCSEIRCSCCVHPKIPGWCQHACEKRAARAHACPSANPPVVGFLNHRVSLFFLDGLTRIQIQQAVGLQWPGKSSLIFWNRLISFRRGEAKRAGFRGTAKSED